MMSAGTHTSSNTNSNSTPLMSALACGRPTGAGTTARKAIDAIDEQTVNTTAEAV